MEDFLIERCLLISSRSESVIHLISSFSSYPGPGHWFVFEISLANAIELVRKAKAENRLVSNIWNPFALRATHNALAVHATLGITFGQTLEDWDGSGVGLWIDYTKEFLPRLILNIDSLEGER